MLGGIGLVFALGLEAFAEPAPSGATIAVPEVEVRSGPSSKFYPTSKLHRGDAVRVLREENGWLAIVPPAPESFSWINANFVEQTGPSVTVKAAEAPVRVGSRLVNEPPSVERIRVKQGTQLLVIGRAETSSEGSWLPILPAPAEVRYIPADAIKASPAVQQTASAPATVVPPSFSNPGGMASAPPTPGPAGNPLLTEAEQAERQGNFREAERLYEQLARQVSLTDHDLAMRCLNRSQYLRDSERYGTQPSRDPRSEGRLTPTSTNPYPYGQATTTSRAVQSGQATSQYCYERDVPSTVRLSAPAYAMPAAPTPPPAPQAQWFGPGRLYRTCFNVDGKPAYGFETSNGQSHLYVTASPGANLESQVGHNAYLYGPIAYRGELRTYHLTALQVNPLP
jgi:hypothetical protein